MLLCVCACWHLTPLTGDFTQLEGLGGGGGRRGWVTARIFRLLLLDRLKAHMFQSDPLSSPLSQLCCSPGPPPCVCLVDHSSAALLPTAMHLSVSAGHLQPFCLPVVLHAFQNSCFVCKVYCCRGPLYLQNSTGLLDLLVDFCIDQNLHVEMCTRLLIPALQSNQLHNTQHASYRSIS